MTSTEERLHKVLTSALKKFPYPDPHIETFSVNSPEEIAESGQLATAELAFTAGKLLDEKLDGVGLLDLYFDEEQEYFLNGAFLIIRNDDLENGLILPEERALYANCHWPKKTWNFWISR